MPRQPCCRLPRQLPIRTALDETIGSVVRITPILVGVKACAIFLWEEGRFRPAQAYGFSEEVQASLSGRDFLPGDFPLLDVVRECAQMTVGLLAQSGPHGLVGSCTGQH